MSEGNGTAPLTGPSFTLPRRIPAAEMSAQQRNATIDGLVTQVVTLTREANADRTRLSDLDRTCRDNAVRTDRNIGATFNSLTEFIDRSFMARLRWLVLGK